MSLTPPPPATLPAEHGRRALIAVGWLLVGGFVGLCVFLGDYRGHLRLFQVGWVAAFIGYALVLAAVWSVPAERVPGRWSWWLAGFVLLRVALLPTAPSDDLHRYVWEGRIQNCGFNPFTYAPNDERLRGLRAGDENWPRINHPDYAAIYPPLAQLFFRAVARVSQSVYAMKACLVGVEIAGLLLLGSHLRVMGISPYRSTVYGLCPLVLVAFGVDGHLDPLMLLGLLLAVRWALSGRWKACAAALGLAIAAKVVAVVLLPWLMVRRPRAALLAVVVAAATCLPYADAGVGLIGGLLRFGGETNIGPFAGLLARLIPQAAAVRVVCAAGLLAFLAYLAWRPMDFSAYATRALAGLVVALPVVHLWYLTWFLLFAWARLRWSWLVLAAAAGAYFEAERVRLLTGSWALPPWVSPVIAGVFAVAWIGENVVRRRARGAS